MASVVVIGAGVMGLSTAVVLQRRMPHICVTLITEHLSPETTGDGSAGFWEPYLLENTSPTDILRWSKRTYAIFLELWKSSSAGDAGICLVPVISLSEDPNQPPPYWKHAVLGYKEMSEKEVSKFNTLGRKQFKSGFQFISFTCEPIKYLPMLLQEFKTRGGVLQLSHINTLDEFSGTNYDVIVNCTGLQSKFVVPDPNMFPIRGQVMRVKAPSVFHCFMDDCEDGCYIIPNQETTVLGGTRQKDWNLEIDKNDSQDIYSKCTHLMPCLKGAEIVKEWVGLRPARFQVRLERESRKLSNGQEIEIVHNYGHGGAGVTLSWGCAEDATNIIQKILQEKTSRAKL